MSKEKILEVKNLTISFRTPNGLVRAVRDVSFDLFRGETLTVVGESGSGKSVTARAIMGILAGNAIIDDGQILYRNQDLTELSEENFHKIRGNKIGMIFQDPLSSLNPIMKIGKQITEAMLVNGDHDKTRLRDLYHHEFHDYLNKITLIKLTKKSIDFKKAEVSANSELSKKEKKAELSEFTAKKTTIINQLKKDLPSLKSKYLEKKKSSKIQVKQEIAETAIEKNKVHLELNKELKNINLSLKSEVDKDKKAQIREQIKEVKFRIAESNESFTRRHKVTRRQAYEKAISIMKEVGIDQPEKRFNQYPFQFSGGMRQRIVIAIALTADPELLICDEPTTALDVTIQGQILNLIKSLKKERGLSVIFITHDLGVVANLASRVAVMYAGKIVEYGTAEDVFYHPQHPYTWALLSSVPDLDTTAKLLSIPGTPPDMLFPPKGDAFADRNKYALKIDFEEPPPFFKISDSHYAATWLLHENAPKIDMPDIINDRIAKYKEQIDIHAKKHSKLTKSVMNEGDQVE